MERALCSIRHRAHPSLPLPQTKAQGIHRRRRFGAPTAVRDIYFRWDMRIVVPGDADLFRRAADFDCVFHRRDPHLGRRRDSEHADQSERPHGGDGGMHGGAALRLAGIGSFDGFGVNFGGMGADLFEAAYVEAGITGVGDCDGLRDSRVCYLCGIGMVEPSKSRLICNFSARVTIHLAALLQVLPV